MPSASVESLNVWAAKAWAFYCRRPRRKLRLPRPQLSVARSLLAFSLLVALWPSHALSAGEAGSTGQDPRKLAEEFVDHSVASFLARAQQQILSDDILRLERAAKAETSSAAQLAQLDASCQAALTLLLEKNFEPVELTIDKAASQQLEGLSDQKCKATWIALRQQRNRDLITLVEKRATEQVAGQLATTLSMDNRWFWLFGLIAVATLALVSWHDRRHEYRRRLNGGKARALGIASILRYFVVLLAILTASVFFFGDHIYNYLVTLGTEAGGSPIGALRREVDDLQIIRIKAEADAKDIDAAWSKATEVWLKQAGLMDARAAAWKKSRRALQEMLIQSKLHEQIAAGVELDANELREHQTDLVAHDAAIRGLESFKGWTRAGIGCTLMGLTGFGALTFLRGVRRRQQKTADTCPLCLGEGTLKPENEAAASGAHSGLQMLRCSNVITEDPFEECDFSFLQIYREMTKLCFPTLGIPSSGKTHWLAMVYREFNRGNHPPQVQFSKVKSRSSEEFDRMVDDIINGRLGTMATQTASLPHPIVFNFRDHDRFLSSNVLVNIFDYSGEIVQKTLDSPHRRRALNGDGYLFFLDPTRSSDEQAKALVDFREDVRAVRGVRSGKAIRSPVALCVSKIDLLVNQAYANPQGGDAIERFYQELEATDPTRERLSLDVMRARSELIGALRDTIWPGWQIERQIHELFGGRCMYFPLTPVGLDELGVTQLHDRVISPFGIMEPLLWLLHMNGYPVLD